MALLSNDLADVETEVRFGRIYSSLTLIGQAFLAVMAILTISDQISTPDALAEFTQVLLSPLFLTIHIMLVLSAIYLAKRASGHKRSLALPHHTKPIRGDPTKGPIIRRTVLRIKGFIFRISPLKTVLHGIIILSLAWLLVFYVVVCFGAPALSQHWETSSFASLLVVLTVLPIVLIYGPETDGYGGLVHVLFSDQNELKLSDPLGHQLFVNCCGAVVGSWIGAFPIPLDWDRSWQKWPISCAVASLVASFLANSVSLLRLHFICKRLSSSKKKKT